MSETKAPTSAPTPRANASRFGVDISGFKTTIWRYDLNEAQTFEDCLIPRFWIDCAEKVLGHDKINPKGRFDQIRCVKPDTSHVFELVIEAIGAGFIKTKVGKDFGGEVVAELPESFALKPKWNVGKQCYEVIRKDNSTLMSSGFQNKSDAQAWITDHVKAMAA